MDFKNRETFLPTKETLRKYLSTNKEDFNVGGSTQKPLISDSGISADLLWVCLVGIIEMLGFVLTIVGGAKRSSSFLTMAILAIVVIIVFDIVFGMWLHRNKGRDNWIEAKKPTVSVDQRNELERYKNNTQDRIIVFVLIVFLILIAMFKSVALFMMHPFTGITIYIPISLLFLLASYIHIRHTGNVLAHRKTQKGILRDYKNSKNLNDDITGTKYFNTTTPLRDLPLKAGFHRIDKTQEYNEEERGFHYALSIKRLMTDDEAILLGISQTNENQTKIFKTCREYQFDIVNKPKGAPDLNKE